MIGLAAAAFMALQASSPVPTQEASIPSQERGARLEDVEVVGRPLDQLIRDFVDEVAAPNNGRGIARWDNAVCVGVANLQGDLARYIVDRVSTVGADLGLTVGQPGCSANILIIATSDGDALATELVRLKRRAFRMGGSGMDRGGSALEDFQHSGAPVRWWQQAMRVDSSTGQRAQRLPGECANACANAYDMGPTINQFAASRLTTQIVDNIFRTIVIVDIEKAAGVNSEQLADYIAMVTFAQINPQAETSSYASILNLFGDPDMREAGLTDWDQTYLDGLYAAQRTRSNVRAGKSEIMSSIAREHRNLRNNQEESSSD